MHHSVRFAGAKLMLFLQLAKLTAAKCLFHLLILKNRLGFE
jgi:hypothetical protein